MRLFQTLLTVLLLSTAVTVSAEMKIAVIDPMIAVLASDAAKEAKQTLDKDLADATEKMKKLRMEIQEIENRISKEGMTMAEADRKKVAQQGEDKVTEYRSLTQIVQRRAKEGEQVLFQKMAPLMEKALETLTKEEGFDLIIQSQAVVYKKPEIDITKRVTELLNKQTAK